MTKNSKRVSVILSTAQHEKINSAADIEKLQRRSGQLGETTKRIEETSRQLRRTIGKSHGGAHPARTQAAEGTQKEEPVVTTFPIVGIGASAGGLEAMTQLLKSLPADTGMAFVLVPHLDPTHESALSSLLARATSMPVSEARNNAQLEPNHVYVIPPNKSISILERV